MPEQLRIKTWKAWDEFGVPASVVLTAETVGAPRTFTIFSHQTLNLTEHKCDASLAIHELQADDTFKAYAGRIVRLGMEASNAFIRLEATCFRDRIFRSIMFICFRECG